VRKSIGVGSDLRTEGGSKSCGHGYNHLKIDGHISLYY